MQFLRPLILSILLVLSIVAYTQIGTHIPYNRLPMGSADLWENAGCAALDGTFIITQFLDVKLMGAIGDSLSDDTPVIQQAIALAEQEAASGGFTMIYFPPGFYRMTEQLELPASTVIKGESSENTTLFLDHYEHGIIIGSSCEYTGIEDLCFKRVHDIIEQDYFIIITGAESCWLWGLETYFANSSHIRLGDCEFIEIRGCYIHKSSSYDGGGNGYGIAIGSEAKQCLIEDNVFRSCRHSIVTGGPCHWNVVGYNASYDPVSWTTGGLPEWVTGDIQVHGNSGNPGNDHGAYENLFEGNYFNWIWIDAYWGDNGPFNTFFRNSARKGGLILEDHYESSHGGIHVNCNDSQNVVNNFCRNLSLALKLRYGSPWGCGHLLGDTLGGDFHFARNNKVYEINYPGQDSTVVYETQGEEPIFLDDISYYHESKPAFLDNLPWPYDPFDTLKRNAAAARYEGGGQITSPAGWGHYNMVGTEEILDYKFILYPNPAKEYINIQLTVNSSLFTVHRSQFTDNLKFEILDLRGVVVGEGNLDGELRIDVRGMVSGIYILNIIKDGERVFGGKVVVWD